MRPQSGSDDILPRVEEVAQHLDVQPVTVYRWCRSGRLRCLKPGKGWRIRGEDLEAFLVQSQRPQRLTGYLERFLTVPDQVCRAEDARVLTRLDAAFFQVGAAQGGLLVKIYDPGTVSQQALAADLRHAGVPVERLERLGQLCWQPATGVAASIAAHTRLVVATGVVEPEPDAWPSLNHQWQLLLSHVVAPPPP